MSNLWVFIESLAGTGIVRLSPDESRHVAARRLRAADSVVAFDGAGHTATARIESIGKRSVELLIDAIEHVPAPADHWVLATAIPKGERLAGLLPMLVQLGVPVWQPLVLEDSAVRDLDVASARMQRVLVESAKVARRPWLLEVREPIGLDALLAEVESDRGVFYGDREGEAVGVDGDASLIAIGPEAGFSADELRRLRAAGARACSLGPHNMRIETAAVAAVAARFVARGMRPE